METFTYAFVLDASIHTIHLDGQGKRTGGQLDFIGRNSNGKIFLEIHSVCFLNNKVNGRLVGSKDFDNRCLSLIENIR